MEDTAMWVMTEFGPISDRNFNFPPLDIHAFSRRFQPSMEGRSR
jgi:hypothetical protein